MNKISQPKWFKDGKVLIINAPTCGIGVKDQGQKLEP